MATGTGKTRTVIALCDVLMRCNWVKRAAIPNSNLRVKVELARLYTQASDFGLVHKSKIVSGQGFD
jgi:hypothetical protein